MSTAKLIIYYFLVNVFIIFGYCFEVNENCLSKSAGDHAAVYLPKYLFYDVNPPEGFNLRRDVFMRLAIFMRSIQGSDCSAHWHLVLPPWSRLHHWKPDKSSPKRDVVTPWSRFFDVESMKRYSPVVELHEVLNEIKNSVIDATVVLQNFKDAFTDSWSWEDKWQYDDCRTETSLSYIKKDKVYDGYFWGYKNITTTELFCISFQGQASKVKEILDSIGRRLIMIDRAEIILHDWFGNDEYWRCRRSMRFASHLVRAAALFREKYLNSSDESDNTLRPAKWEDEILHRNASGGNYLSVHLRRRDFEINRKDEVPTLDQASQQISELLDKLDLVTVFIATDGPLEFINNLQAKLSKYKVLHYNASLEETKLFKDGGLAIIDQIICSHARYFMGSYESTFSFRIQEEREILGFPSETTFNRFCGSKTPCTKPTQWLIQH